MAVCQQFTSPEEVSVLEQNPDSGDRQKAGHSVLQKMKLRVLKNFRQNNSKLQFNL